MPKSLAIPRHVDWYLEDYIRQNVHPDSAVLEVGNSDGSLLLKIKQILKGKGLKESRKAGAPTLELDPNFQFNFESDTFDVVILNWVLDRPNKDALRVIQQASRVGRKRLLLQCTQNSSWLNLLSSVGAIESERILPTDSEEDSDRRFFVVDISAAPSIPLDKPPAGPSVLDSEPPPSAERISSLPKKVLTQAEKDRMLAKFGDSPAAIAVIEKQPIRDPETPVVSPIHYFDANKVLTDEEEAAGYTTSGHYFRDETGSGVFGPWDTYQEAEEHLKEYADSLNSEAAIAADGAYGAYGAPGHPLEELERTFLIVKPDAFDKKETIKEMVEARGLHIYRQCVSFMFSRDWAELLYSEHQGKPFYEDHISFMCSGECATYEIEGANAVAVLRDLAGATDPQKAEPQTLRGLFGTKLPKNAVHTSDSVESARRELSYFFPGDCCMTKEQKAAARKKDLESISQADLDSLAAATGVPKKSEDESSEHFMDRASKSLETVSASDVGPVPAELLKGL